MRQYICKYCNVVFYGRKRQFCNPICQRKHWTGDHKEEIRKKSKEYYEKHRKRINKYNKEYIKSYIKKPEVREKRNKYSRERYHREKDRMVHIPRIGSNKIKNTQVKYVPRDIRPYFTKEKIMELKNRVLNDCIRNPRKFLRGIKKK